MRRRLAAVSSKPLHFLICITMQLNVDRRAIGQFRIHENKVWYTAFHVKMSFHSHANQNNFHMKDCAPNLALIGRLKTIQEWPIL